MSGPLAGRVAVVAGATRGAGRAIAASLGEAGATVYCTGRSTRGHPATRGRPETIDETAELATVRGGKGLAVRVDHTVEAEVEALFARVADEQAGRLDVLVNDVWGGDELAQWVRMTRAEAAPRPERSWVEAAPGWSKRRDRRSGRWPWRRAS